MTAAQGHGPSPYGISEAVHLNGQVGETSVVIQLQSGPSLTLQAMEAETQKTIVSFLVMLVREDGFPVTRWSKSPWALPSREEDGRLVFPQLAPGSYRLEARCPARYANLPEYKLVDGPMLIQLMAGADQQITAPLQRVILSAAEVRRRWPFLVRGRVTDERGMALEGVTVTAQCGIGTLHQTGEAKSGPDGNYAPRFTGGMRMMDGDHWRIGLQVAAVSPSKHGYFEARRNPVGDLLMADRMPQPNEDSGWQVLPDRVLLPDEPFGFDFVMVQAPAR